VTATETAWLVIAAGTALTYGIRAVFLVLAGRLTALPPIVQEGLRMIPAAALAALTAPAVLRPAGDLELLSARSLAAAIAGLVVLRTRNTAATIVAGLVAVVVLAQVPGL
jgi:branched-subunit amino acid transport protein